VVVVALVLMGCFVKAAHNLLDALFSDSNDKWFPALSGWLEHISLLIEAATDAVQEVLIKLPIHPTNHAPEQLFCQVLGGRIVCIHCSDGWDRTAQISSLAQVLLDP
jgi:hypothetical protein